jgi:hypothetical protein
MPASPSASGSLSDSDTALWAVQEILAKRRTLSGGSEYLVVWKSSWISASAVKNGPGLRDWQKVAKFKSPGFVMAITLPVMRGTQLYDDCAHIRAGHPNVTTGSIRVPGAGGAGSAASIMQARPIAAGQPQQLGGIAKKAARKQRQRVGREDMGDAL